MSKRALIIVKEISGVATLAARLVEDFGFELLANEVAGEELTTKGIAFNPVDENDAAKLVANREEGIALVVANFMNVETAGRNFMSWKSALAAFDRAIVDAIRAAGWAADRMAVVGDPGSYAPLLENMQANNGKLSQSFRVQQATKALRAASEFDFAVAQYLEIHGADAPDMGALSGYPKAMRLAWSRAQTLDTGENRHQQAALYGSFYEHFEKVSGSALNYESVLTISRAAYLIGEFEKPAAALLRKGRVVNVACGNDLPILVAELLENGQLDNVWLVANGSIGIENLDTIIASKASGLILPDASPVEREKLSTTNNICALVSKSGLGYEALQEVRSVVGGALVQDKDRAAVNPMEWTVQGLVQPLVDDWEPLVFAVKVARHLESSACVCLKGERIVALDYGRHSQAEAWTGLADKGIGSEDTLVVFDETIESAELLKKVKAAGVRLVLHPSAEVNEELRNAANELGLCLMTTSKGLRKL